MNDLVARLDKLDELRKNEPQTITQLYLNLFTTVDGQMVLTDLMDHFFEFKPTSNDHEAGSQAVIIYIKNRLLGVTEQINHLPQGE